jgi:hypothetical protein
MHEFRLGFEDLERMSAFQFYFLLAWLEWYYERLERLRRRR